jgi:predicted permease
MGSSSASIRVPGSERTATRPADVETVYIAPRYFETLGAPLLRGREFDRNDGPNSRKVAIVNEAFVRAFLATEQHPENRYLSFDDAKPEGGERTWIVGVVRDMRRDGVQKPPAPAVYVPLAQADAGWPSTVLIRTQQPPASILPVVRREAARLGSSIVVDDFGTVRQRIDDSIFEQRLLAAVSGFFGLLALLLASVGLYGVVAYGTARRTAEIGVRIALGARRGQVLRMILGDSLALVAVGLGVGLLASVAAAKAVASILFGITPTDPVAFLGTGALLLATAVLATLLPARRAASIDPLRALRHE